MHVKVPREVTLRWKKNKFLSVVDMFLRFLGIFEFVLCELTLRRDFQEFDSSSFKHEKTRREKKTHKIQELI